MSAPDERITLNGNVYVILSKHDEVVDERDGFRQALALAHARLVMGQDVETAVSIIQRATGYTVEDARAVASIVQQARRGAL